MRLSWSAACLSVPLRVPEHRLAGIGTSPCIRVACKGQLGGGYSWRCPEGHRSNLEFLGVGHISVPLPRRCMLTHSLGSGIALFDKSLTTSGFALPLRPSCGRIHPLARKAHGMHQCVSCCHFGPVKTGGGDWPSSGRVPSPVNVCDRAAGMAPCGPWELVPGVHAVRCIP